MDIRDLQRQSWEIAESKGWHEDEEDTTFGDRIALCHTELSEALEDFRVLDKDDDSGIVVIKHDENGKPLGIPIEFADVIIRVAHMCEIYDIDLEEAIDIKMAYNRTRPYRHGGKRL